MRSLFHNSNNIETCTSSPKCSHHEGIFPYKEFPPPAPPGGESAWDLQFCRWWGWNWVRKKRSGTLALASAHQPPKNDAEASGRRFEKRRLLQSQFPSKQKRQKKTTQRVPPLLIGQETDGNQCRCHEHRNQLSAPISPLPTKRELKKLCKCLVFQKPSGILPPPEMQDLYNTPSNSVFAIRKSTYGTDEDQIKSSKDKEQYYIGHKKTKKRSWTKHHHSSSSEEAIVEPTSLYRPHSSTEESIEYLTLRLQQIKSNLCCPCRQYSCKRELEPVKQTTEIQTLREKQEDKGMQTIKSSQRETEHRALKYRGKNKKTICIMVCCCGSCPQAQCDNIKSSNEPKEDISLKDNIKKGSELSERDAKPPRPCTEKDVTEDATNSFYDKDYYESPLTGKTYRLGPLIFNNDEQLKLPELIDVNEDLECLKRLGSIAKSEEEHRVMLDAVCDAILSEHSQAKYNPCKLFHKLIHGDNQATLSQDLKNNEHGLDFDKPNSSLISSGSATLIKRHYRIPNNTPYACAAVKQLSSEKNKKELSRDNFKVHESKETVIQLPKYQFKNADKNPLFRKIDLESTSPLQETAKSEAPIGLEKIAAKLDENDVKLKKQTTSKYRIPRWSINAKSKNDNEIHKQTGDQNISIQINEDAVLEATAIKKLYTMSSNFFELNQNVETDCCKRNYSIFSDINKPTQFGPKSNDSSKTQKEQNRQSAYNFIIADPKSSINVGTNSTNILAGIGRHYTGSSLIPVRKKSSLIANKKTNRLGWA